MYLFRRHEDDLAFKNHTADNIVINIAIFGIGRAGTIHLSNIVRNPRCKLLYIVDDIEANWSKIKKHFSLNDVIFLTSKQSEKIFSDSK